MFCPVVFREDRPEVLRALIRAHPLGTLVTHGAGWAGRDLVPFTLVEQADGPDLLRAHLARVNGQVAALLEAAEALVCSRDRRQSPTPRRHRALASGDLAHLTDRRAEAG